MRVPASFLHRPATSRLMALLLAGAAIAAPVTIDFGPGKAPALSAAFAHAKGGDDHGGGGGRGGDDNGGGHGRGGDDRGGDNHGGRGRGGDDEGRDDHGRGRGADDGVRGADRGRGRGRDDDRRAPDNPGTIGAPTGGVPTRVERSARGIEVTYSDGWREELENGRYELKDAQNRTVVERPATRQDYNRLGAIAR
jgi:hypothetical protein